MKRAWKYLETEPFSVRQAIAARFVRDCGTILEIGGYASGLLPYLRGPHKTYWCVDPRIDGFSRGGPHKVGGRVIAKEVLFDSMCVKDIHKEFDCDGLVALGYDLPPDDNLVRFLDLVNESEIVVVESWEDWSPWEILKDNLSFTNKVVKTRVRLDLSGNDLGDMSGSFPPRFNRELLVLR